MIVALTSLTASSIVATPSHVTAQCPDDAVGCHEQGVDFHWREGFLDSVMLDSGWVPSGSPLQVRVALFAGGETEIDLAGTSFTWWPRPLSEQVPGLPGSGLLSVDYGFEYIARVRFDVEVAGIRYRWEGDIPTGSFPRDLRLAAMMAFDSMLLPPQTPRPITVEDVTERIEIVGLDIGDLIGISGVSGGFALQAEGDLEATYRTDRIEITDATPITMEAASTPMSPGDGATDYGASKDVVIQPIGSLDYQGSINLHPVFYIEVLGRRFDLGIAPIPVPLVNLDRDVVFDPEMVHVPLPDVAGAPLALDFGEVEVGARGTRRVELRNEGEAPLHVAPRTPTPPFLVLVDEVTIPPGDMQIIEVRFEPETGGSFDDVLVLETNDPDEDLIEISLSGVGLAVEVPDAGIPEDDAGVRTPGGLAGGACACGVAGAPARGTAPWALLLGLGLALGIRRRLAR